MSQENVEAVHAQFEAWNAGDMDAFGEQYDPHVVVRYVDDWPEGSEPIMGREAVMRQWQQQREAFDADTAELIEIIDLGDRVVTRFIWRAAGSGPDLSIEVTSVATVRNGKSILVEFFWDHNEALKAVGLSGQAIPVSRANVEIVRAALQAIGPGTNRDDWINEFFDPEVEWHDVPTYPSAGVYIGHEAFSRHAAEFEEAWADWGIEIEDIKPAGERVVARIRYRGVGKLSGASITGGVENPSTGAVFELRGGRIARVVQFVTHAEALGAVGLSE
jgi:ketosteroid isomerase-like protein